MLSVRFKFVSGISLFLTLVSCIYFATACSTPEPDRYWGFMDKRGHWVVPPKYDEVGTSERCGWWCESSAGGFCQERCAVCLNNKWGFIDKSGREVIPLIYDDVSHFSEGLAAVRQGSNYGYIDRDGKVAIPIKLDMTPYSYKSEESGEANGTIRYYANSVSHLYFSNGRALYREGDKYGYIDKTGKVVIPVQYRCASAFEEGLAKVSIAPERDWRTVEDWDHNDTGSDYIDVDNHLIVSADKGCFDYSDGMFLATNGKPYENCRYSFYDRKNMKQFGSYVRASKFSEGLALVAPVNTEEMKGSYGIINKAGEFVVKPGFSPDTNDVYTVFHEGRAVLSYTWLDFTRSSQYRYGVVDTSGRMVLPVKFHSIEAYHDGVAVTWTDAGRTYFDKNGTAIFSRPGRGAGNFSEGLAPVESELLK